MGYVQDTGRGHTPHCREMACKRGGTTPIWPAKKARTTSSRILFRKPKRHEHRDGKNTLVLTPSSLLFGRLVGHLCKRLLIGRIDRDARNKLNDGAIDSPLQRQSDSLGVARMVLNIDIESPHIAQIHDKSRANRLEYDGSIAVGHDLKAVGTRGGDLSFGLETDDGVLLGLGKVASEDGHDGQDSQRVCSVGRVDIDNLAFWIEYFCEFVDGDSGAEAELKGNDDIDSMSIALTDICQEESEQDWQDNTSKEIELESVLGEQLAEPASHGRGRLQYGCAAEEAQGEQDPNRLRIIICKSMCEPNSSHSVWLLSQPPGLHHPCPGSHRINTRIDLPFDDIYTVSVSEIECHQRKLLPGNPATSPAAAQRRLTRSLRCAEPIRVHPSRSQTPSPPMTKTHPTPQHPPSLHAPKNQKIRLSQTSPLAGPTSLTKPMVPSLLSSTLPISSRTVSIPSSHPLGPLTTPLAEHGAGAVSVVGEQEQQGARHTVRPIWTSYPRIRPLSRA
ncbi:hypothetical protein AG1IA_00314 [Rhizoctonia solani AG-1 IA]|uniref:Uncharacterized protein n=1 Tax=Thanatephorus cucumeris (strain AG1-IA) TaxID=983506 RepID=L8X5S4_THACA|nr:hypothetical protein AG1IA_00314 [Rhizoctonia solani AG-1 IA]